MEGVTHRIISTNGILIHFVEMGSGPVVLFLHGFPEGWYAWRKQLPTFMQAGYRVIAPDMRGYGDSSAPQGVSNYTYLHIIGDLIGLLDALEIEKICLFRPDRIVAHAALSAHFLPRKPSGSLVQMLRAVAGEDHYICQFQIPGKVEAWIEKITPDVLFRRVFGRKLEQKLRFSSDLIEKIPLPKWISEDDVAFYVSEFAKHGFTPALNYYRALDLSWELTAPWTGSKVVVPSIFIVGDEDIGYEFIGAKDYIEHGMINDVPLLKETIVLKGVQHFVHLEQPEVVNDHILKFFKDFPSLTFVAAL